MKGSILRVVEAIADADGVEPRELEFRLHDHVDTETLRRLDAMDDTEWELTFEVPGHEVTVSSDGPVLVDGERHHGVRASDDGEPGVRDWTMADSKE